MEGFIPVEGGKVWYKMVGERKGIPLILLHGGPGYPHDYLEPLEDLAQDRQVVFYDQLGCGNSDNTTDPKLWTVDHFVKELQQVIDHLGFEKYHLLGHSWGSALAVAFALTQPRDLLSIIFSDPYISTPHWEKDAQRLIAQLPPEMQSALIQSPQDSEEYKRASKEYYDRYVFRLNPRPEPAQRANKKINRELYHYMWGPEEYRPTGTLKNFDPSAELSTIGVSTLFVTGRFDEATPESAEYFKSLMPKATLIVFEQSAHFPFWNEREKYMRKVGEFLKEAENT